MTTFEERLGAADHLDAAQEAAWAMLTSAPMPRYPKRVRVLGNSRDGYKVPPGAVYVGRDILGLTSPFACEFDPRKLGVAEARRLYLEKLQRSSNAGPDAGILGLARRILTGKDLACICPLDIEWCHASDLLRVVNYRRPGGSR